jgi:hypothetical protein
MLDPAMHGVARLDQGSVCVFGAEEEDRQLRAMVQGLGDDDRETIYRQGLQLLQEQNKPSDVSCLPTLHIDEVSAARVKGKDMPLEPVLYLSTGIMLWGRLCTYCEMAMALLS